MNVESLLREKDPASFVAVVDEALPETPCDAELWPSSLGRPRRQTAVTSPSSSHHRVLCWTPVANTCHR